MKRNSTKDKGDKGLAYVVADLIGHGFYIFLPISEHLPFDLVVANDKGKLARVQVKYRKLDKHGSIAIKLSSVYSNARGTHITPTDPASYDGMAIYCPDTKLVYYVPVKSLMRGDKCLNQFNINVHHKGNHHIARGVEGFLKPEGLFGDVAEWSKAPRC